jgi:hypothetical protein
LKAALDMVGRVGGVPRPPLRPVGPAALENLRGILASLGLLEESHAASR